MTDVLTVERHYTVAETAEKLHVSKGWVYKRIRAGQIPVVELGDDRSNQRVSASALQTFLDSRTYGVHSTT